MHSISAFFISQLPNNAAVASRSVLLLDQSQKNHGKNIYEQSILLHKDHDAVSVAEGGSPTTYVNARLCGRMVVVTTYKMQRFMQIMTFCLFALHNSQQGGARRKLSKVPDKIFRNKPREIERNLNSEC